MICRKSFSKFPCVSNFRLFFREQYYYIFFRFILFRICLKENCYLSWSLFLCSGKISTLSPSFRSRVNWTLLSGACSTIQCKVSFRITDSHRKFESSLLRKTQNHRPPIYHQPPKKSQTRSSASPPPPSSLNTFKSLYTFFIKIFGHSIKNHSLKGIEWKNGFNKIMDRLFCVHFYR